MNAREVADKAWAEQRTKGAVELVRSDLINPVPIDWVWTGYLAKRKLELIVGPPEAGKTTIATDFAATISRAGKWPDGTQAPLGDVLIWSAEDDWDDTIVPRLIACGADRARIHKINGTPDEKGNLRAFDPAQDIPALRLAAQALPNLVLTIIEPVVLSVTGDSHKNAEVRRGLTPLCIFAQETVSCVLGITHFTKGTSGKDPIERITGSLAFGAAPRLVMAAVKPKDPGEKYRLVRAKNNIGPSGGGFEYDLVRKELPDHGIAQAQWICWGDKIDGTAREMLDDAEGIEPPKQDRTRLAAAWLRDQLSNGPLEQQTIQARAKNDGIAWSAVRRANKKIVGAIAQKDEVADGPWRWHLPSKMH